MRASKKIAILAGLALVIGAAGCALFMAEDRKSIEVHAASSNVLTVEGKTVAMKDLVSTLKSAGAGPNTLVTVDIAQDAPSATVTMVRDTLKRGGFPKMLIKKPRAPSATVGPVRTK
jgi:biopolymer transport protein ExbD